LVVAPVRTSERTHEDTNEPTNQRTPARPHVHAKAAPSTTNGVEAKTLMEMLATAASLDLDHGPFQAATVRMPVELWKRIGWVASLTGRTKQAVIGEALSDYLEKLTKSGAS
jgi:hypothetical protein